MWWRWHWLNKLQTGEWKSIVEVTRPIQAHWIDLIKLDLSESNVTTQLPDHLIGDFANLGLPSLRVSIPVHILGTRRETHLSRLVDDIVKQEQ